MAISRQIRPKFSQLKFIFYSLSQKTNSMGSVQNGALNDIYWPLAKWLVLEGKCVTRKTEPPPTIFEWFCWFLLLAFVTRQAVNRPLWAIWWPCLFVGQQFRNFEELEQMMRSATFNIQRNRRKRNNTSMSPHALTNKECLGSFWSICIEWMCLSTNCSINRHILILHYDNIYF